MRKFFTLTLFAALVTLDLYGQSGIPGFFELRVTDIATGTNRAVVQARAINNVIPQVTVCDGNDEFTTYIIGGFKFAVSWPGSSPMTNVNVGSNNAPGICPDPSDNGGTAGHYNLLRANAAPLTANDGSRVTIFQMNGLTNPTPDNWVLNEWITICTLNITQPTPGCTLCDDMRIVMIGDFPELQGNNDLDHTFALAVEQGNPALEYDLSPNNAPLPLNLVSFEAEKYETQDALLSWTTANEENTSHFQIQRSFDKKNWYDAGSVSAAGYSIATKNYTFMDSKVYNGRDARLPVYYRLNMVDLDGRSKLSPIQTVIFGNSTLASNSFSVYPNPSTDGVQVEWDANNIDQPTLLEIYDVTGKLVLQQKVSENANQEYIDFGPAKITSGLYLLRIMNGTEPIDHKQIVVGQSR